MRRNVERATQMAMSEVAFQLNPSILGWYKERLESFCGDVIWNSWAPTKVSFFLYEKQLERDNNYRNFNEVVLDFSE